MKSRAESLPGKRASKQEKEGKMPTGRNFFKHNHRGFLTVGEVPQAREPRSFRCACRWLRAKAAPPGPARPAPTKKSPVRECPGLFPCRFGLRVFGPGKLSHRILLLRRLFSHFPDLPPHENAGSLSHHSL